MTGSTGDGYQLAFTGGMTLCHCDLPKPIETKEEWCRECMGLSFENVTLTLWEKGKKKTVICRNGRNAFYTFWGYQIPLVLTASTYLKESYPVTIWK